jgi:hypothetical protein
MPPYGAAERRFTGRYRCRPRAGHRVHRRGTDRPVSPRRRAASPATRRAASARTHPRTPAPTWEPACRRWAVGAGRPGKEWRVPGAVNGVAALTSGTSEWSFHDRRTLRSRSWRSLVSGAAVLQTAGCGNQTSAGTVPADRGVRVATGRAGAGQGEPGEPAPVALDQGAEERPGAGRDHRRDQQQHPWTAGRTAAGPGRSPAVARVAPDVAVRAAGGIRQTRGASTTSPAVPSASAVWSRRFPASSGSGPFSGTRATAG